jgi:hypothetical protein
MNAVIDMLALTGLLAFPIYALYWVARRLRMHARRRLWLVIPAFLAWATATFFCLLLPMLGCMGGGCAGRVSPFLELALLHAVTSVVLILLLHRYRGHGPGPLRNGPPSGAAPP